MKEELAKIRAELGKLEESETILAKINPVLTRITEAFKGLELDLEDQKSSYNVVHKETMKRKATIGEKDEEIVTLKSEIETLKNDDKYADHDDLVKYKADREAEVIAAKKVKRQTFIDGWKMVTEHTDFEKTKVGFKVGEEKDGEVDWESIEDDDMVANANKLTEYKGLGFFGDPKGGGNDRGGGRIDLKDKKIRPFKNIA